MIRRRFLAVCVVGLLAACGTPPRPPDSMLGREIALYALALLDTGYKFGGKNPEAGLDCSGMVSHVFAQAIGLRISGSAADIARRGQRIARETLAPGDLVFFDTGSGPHSHVGIYLGEDRFVHAPSSRGQVRTERLSQGWFADRFREARRYVN